MKDRPKSTNKNKKTVTTLLILREFFVQRKQKQSVVCKKFSYKENPKTRF